MGWSPWATVGFTMLGLIGGLYLLIKDAIKDNADPKGRKK
jgi:F0F1-type ATP synthase assembly protein I